MNKKPGVVRVYLPPDANTLLVDLRPLPPLAALRERRGRREAAAGRLAVGATRPQRTARGASASGTGPAPSTAHGDLPDVVLACAGDVPTLETLAAAAILRDRLPDLRCGSSTSSTSCACCPRPSTPTACPTASSTRSSPRTAPVIFAFHGYPWLIHRLDLPATQPRPDARARLQGEGHHHDAVRHGDAQRPRPLPPRDGRDRPRARPRPHARPVSARRWSTPGCGPDAGPASTVRTSPRCRLDVARVTVRLLTVNAGSTSMKLVARRRRRAVGRFGSLAEAVADAPRRTRSSHRVVHGGDRDRAGSCSTTRVVAELRRA